MVIEALIAKHGYSPSLREIKDRLNLKSVCAVQSRVGGLIEAGACTAIPGQARTLRVVIPSAAFVKADRSYGDRVQRYQQQGVAV